MVDMDRKTVARLKRGDDDAYIRVVRVLKDPVYRFALRLCRDRDAAEDITQQTFLAVWENIRSFEGRSRFSTWVFGIAYRQYLTVRRWDMQSPDTVPLQEWHQDDDALDPGSAVVDADQRDRLRRAVYALPDPYREVVCLVYLQELTCRETAEVLTIPIGTVKSRMSCALRLLRERLRGSEVLPNDEREAENTTA
jgi:RNA polymerase sigma-70 factor (ECF subfamily)